MASRKEKIKQKREQEEKEIQQVRMAVAGLVVLIVLGVGVYLVVQSGILESPFESLSDLTGTPQEICDQATPASGSGVNGQYASAPDNILENNTDYVAIFCTSAGAIYIDLYEESTPTTVNNMVFLANEGFYNNMIFHRVIEGFMAQGGDPTGTGSGGPGYQFEDEILPDVTFDRPYLLAMANAGPGTNGSQFFITFAETPWLNGLHTIFGEVVAGQEVVDSLPRLQDAQGAPTGGTPADINTIVIVTAEQVTQ
ncbi:MAG: peptidylprolyl isomerase [Chloroflexota bacterium]